MGLHCLYNSLSSLHHLFILSLPVSVQTTNSTLPKATQNSTKNQIPPSQAEEKASSNLVRSKAEIRCLLGTEFGFPRQGPYQILQVPWKEGFHLPVWHQTAGITTTNPGKQLINNLLIQAGWRGDLLQLQEVYLSPWWGGLLRAGAGDTGWLWH